MAGRSTNVGDLPNCCTSPELISRIAVQNISIGLPDTTFFCDDPYCSGGMVAFCPVYDPYNIGLCECATTAYQIR